jgi:hypothetical protein
MPYLGKSLVEYVKYGTQEHAKPCGIDVEVEWERKLRPSCTLTASTAAALQTDAVTFHPGKLDCLCVSGYMRAE